MDKKIIFSLCGNMLTAFAAIFFLPMIYAEFVMRSPRLAILFILLGVVTMAGGIFFIRLGRGHKRRLRAAESAATMLLMYPLLAIFGAIPILLSGCLSPVDSLLETISDLTSAGISILPADAPYVLKLWQSLLMWFGSLYFLILLVTLMPEVSGTFGLALSLHGGQIFSPMFGQMFSMARRMVRVYVILSLVSFAMFKLAGLNFWDALLMAMRCISTGGGNFFPSAGNIYVEYAAAFTMLMACGNFLLYHRLIYTLPPSERNSAENIFRRTANYFKRLKQNVTDNIKNFFADSEVKTVGLILLLGVSFIFLSLFRQEYILDGNQAFRYAFFHLVSFLSTTGISLPGVGDSPDFDRFLIFLMAIFGGCMGSPTGGLKILRVIILAKVFKAEVRKVMHPHMISNVRIRRVVVPNKTVGNILNFFFLSAFTLFICAAILSFLGTTFSKAVAISTACLTNVGVLPDICKPLDFLTLSVAGKFFCMLILIVGRIEIFALLIFIASIRFKRSYKGKW